METNPNTFDADVAMKVYQEELEAKEAELRLWKMKFYQLQKITNQLLDTIEASKIKNEESTESE